MTPTSHIELFLVIFASIVFEALPFIILGALISGTLEELLPQRLITNLLPKRRSRAIAGSALLGLVFPMCECGIVPVMRRLLGKGLPLSCAVAYMLAAPIINPVVIASTWAAFSGDRSGPNGDGLTSFQMVTLRVGLAFLTAFIVGMVVERRMRKQEDGLLIAPPRPDRGHGEKEGKAEETTPHQHHHHDHDHATCGHDHSHDHASGEHSHDAPHAHDQKSGLPVIESAVHDAFATPELQKKTWFQRLASISETALRDFVDISCFLILGAFLAATIQAFDVIKLLPDTISDPILGPLLIVPVMMLLAILLCLCSEADAFVAAGLIKVPLGGKLSFLVLGPMLDLKLYMMYTRVFKPRLIWTIIPWVIGTVFILTLTAHYLDWTARR